MNETSDPTRILPTAHAGPTRLLSQSVRPAQAASGAMVVAGSTEHSGPSAETVASASALGFGSILKQRFELVELLGSGGMGAVYRARDLRQVEAGDHHPWVALKIINEQFARHEHALAALQQETKKTQRLAHPNIVSVHDFDRAGDIAFMTMELLEGQSLDVVLQRHPAGLPPVEALSIIRQISQAIAYAHKQGVVHADLKPANIFLARDGRVKVLDFGIALAMQTEETNSASNVATPFDPHSLNALTPAYASVHMLSGQRARAVDDLYALGCIFYLLLTGRHPYHRKRATEAEAAQLKPARIAALPKSRWRALMQLLQFRPDAGYAIAQFQSAFFNEAEQRLRRLGVSVAAGLLVVVLAAVGINAWLDRHLHKLARNLGAVNVQTVEYAAQDIRQLSPADRVIVLEQAKDAVAEQIDVRLQALVTAHEYRQLGDYLRVMRELYPDSSRVQDAFVQFEQRQQVFVDTLAAHINTRIQNRDFTSGPPTFAEQIQALREVAAQHPLFRQLRLKNLLAREAGVAIYLGERERAQVILAQAEQLFPEDAGRFDQIRQRMSRTTANSSRMPQPVATPTHNGFSNALTLLQQFDVSHDSSGLVRYLEELRHSEPDLYYVLLQGLQDFVAERQQAGHGKAVASLREQLGKLSRPVTGPAVAR